MRLQPPRLFQTNSHFRFGAIETKSGCGTTTARSLGKTNRKGTKGLAPNASSIASILILDKAYLALHLLVNRTRRCRFTTPVE